MSLCAPHAGEQYAAMSSNEYNVFFQAPDRSKHTLGTPQLFNAAGQPLAILQDAAFSDDDNGALICVSKLHFKFKLPQNPAPPTTDAMYLKLSVLPCAPASSSKWTITTNITTTLASNVIAINWMMAGPTYFVFNPDVAAIGLFLYSFCTYPQELFVSTLPSGTNVDQGVAHVAAAFPSISNFTYSSTKTMLISGPSFIHAPFLIVNFPNPEDPTDGLALVAIDVYALIPGQPQTATVHSNDRTMYKFVGLNDVTTITLTLESFTGDADLFVHTQPFMKSSSNCRCLWSSISSSMVQSLTITNLDLNWSPTLYIIVSNSGPAMAAGLNSYFRLTGHAYQQLDDGQIVHSSLQPLQYAYFAGQPNSGVPVLEQDLAFSANLAVSPLAPATISLFAGSWSLYSPIVQQGYAEISVPSVSAGNNVAVQSQYVQDTGVDRQMLVSVLSGFSAAMNTDDDAPPAASRRLAVSGSGSLRGGDYRRELRRDVYTAGLTPAQRFRLLTGLAGRRSLQQAAVTVLQASNFAWVTVAQCASGNLACYGLTSISPGATQYLAVPIPARSSLFLIFQTVPVPASAVQPVFTVQMDLGRVPQDSVADANSESAATATSSTLLTINCGYNAQTVYVAATNAAGGALGGITFGFVSGQVYSDQCQQYSWAVSAWFPCSVLCGNGTQSRTVTCQTPNGRVVDPGLCDGGQKPMDTQACAQGACVWSAGPWTDCDATCGGGAQYRKLTCRNHDGVGTVLTEQFCANPPVNAQFCNPQPCPSYYWKPTPWSACSMV